MQFLKRSFISDLVTLKIDTESRMSSKEGVQSICVSCGYTKAREGEIQEGTTQKHQHPFFLSCTPHNPTHAIYYVQLSRQLFAINHLTDVANMFLLTTK